MTSATRPHFPEDAFRKATASQPDRDCVRVARRDGWVELRDDKTTFGAPDDHRIVLTSAEFDRFQADVRSARHPHPVTRGLQRRTAQQGTVVAAADGLPLLLEPRGDGTYLLRTADVTLTFTEPEVRAFVAGIREHEFDLAEYEPTTAA